MSKSCLSQGGHAVKLPHRTTLFQPWHSSSIRSSPISVLIRPHRSGKIHATGSDNSGDDESLEKLLWRELQKRGIPKPEQSQESKSTKRSQLDPAPQFRQEQLRSQLEESRKLNSEGLEGLIPRGKQLLTLGVTFFLAFWPFLLLLSALFSGIFWLSGEKFIHGGRPSYTKYIEPAELLSEPTVDERIPFR